MLIKTVVALAAICTALAVARAEEQPKFGGSFEPTNQDYLSMFGDQQQQQQQNQQQDQQQAAYNATTDVDAVIDTILATGRSGRNLDGFDDVYADPTVQDALAKSDDRQARNIIKDKLCSLGLMDCDNQVQIEGKRPFLPPGELIYSQPPPGYHQSGEPLRQQRPPQYQQQQQQQQRPPPGAYGPPRPMPPPQSQKYTGPPRKVGYAGSPYPVNPNQYQMRPPGQSLYVESKPPAAFYEGPSPPGPIYQGQQSGLNGQQQRPFDGQIFEGPKPPGPIYEDNSSPYKFDSSSSLQQSSHHEQVDKYETVADYPAQKIVGTPAAQPGGNTVNIHHHYHHLDGATDGTKTVVVNPVSATQGSASYVSGSSGSSNSLNGLSASAEYSGLSSGGFSPMNSLGGSSSSSSGGYYNKNQQLGLSSYGNGPSSAAYKPVIEPSNSLIGVSGPGGYDGAVNSYGGAINSGSSSYGSGSGSFNGAQQFGSTGSGGQYGNGGGNSPSQSFHSQHPEFYKKALNTNGGSNGGGASTNSLSSLSQYSKYNTQYNTGENNYQGFETARQESFDCVCVPYDQCPQQDVIGRKDDLILPLDPRNLKTDIEAAADEMSAKSVTNATATTAMTAEKRADEKVADDEKKTDDAAKKVVKREAPIEAEKKADDVALDQADGQARHFGGIPGYGGVGVGGYGGGYPNPLGGKKVVPTFGVSFGLPYPTGGGGYGAGGYPINPFGGAPAVNQNFGSLSPNGLNLGLVNVNPLVSFQVAKNELGEKLFKPLVNLHVTPNANIIQKVGDLWKAKKFGFGGPQVNQHYHTHQHYPQPPEVYHPHHLHHEEHHGHPHHYEGPYLEHPPSSHHQHYESGPPSGPGGYPSGPGGYPSGPGGFSSGPGGYPSGPGGGYGFAGPQHGIYREGGGGEDATYGGQSDPNNYYDQSAQYGPPQSAQGYDGGYDHYSRNSADNNGTIGQQQQPQQQQQFQASYQDVFPQNTQLQTDGGDSIGPGAYADYASYNRQQPQQQQQQQPQNNRGGQRSVAFPSNRRKRSADSATEDGDKPAEAEGRIISGTKSSAVEKRQAYYQQQQQRPQQQCNARQVCCRRPLQQQQQQVPQFQAGQCGRRNTNGITGRIKNPSYIDGDSEFGEYPWQVAILKKDPKESVYICGGTLIDAQHILTAAHCVKTYTNFDLRVRLGEWDVNHDVEFFPYIERDVVSVTVHPEYYAGTLDNDLAIIRLNSPVDFANAPHISPACLPDRHTDWTGARCWTTGWGKDAFGDFGKYQNILKEVDVPVIGQQQCQQQLRSTRLGYSYKLNPGFICAGGEEGKDACKGDGGGPMVCERNGSWQLVGVVSWGIGCGQVNVPGVYVRVAHYLDWIQANTRRF